MIENKIKKEYHAIIKGNIKTINTIILTKSILKNYNTKINDHEKISKTIIKTIKNYNNLSLIKIFPITGRLHQIRIHLTHIGNPIANDEKYGNKTFNKKMKFLNLSRMFLHAKSITFKCPITNELFNIKALYDENIKNFLKKIKGFNNAK